MDTEDQKRDEVQIPCGLCGPGYHLGDEGCGHRPSDLRCPTCDAPIAKMLEAPRLWDLPAEPGPDVTRLRSGIERDAEIWRHNSWWLLRYEPDDEPVAYKWAELVWRFAPLAPTP